MTGLKEAPLGFDSDKLGSFFESTPKNQLFAMILKREWRGLDLVCPPADKAQKWMGLHIPMRLKHGVMRMKKMDQINGRVALADKDHDDKLSYEEVKQLLQEINIGIGGEQVCSFFEDCDKSRTGLLDGREIRLFCMKLTQRPDLEDIFSEYSKNGFLLYPNELQTFLEDQGEDASLRNAQNLVKEHEPDERAKKDLVMTQNGFILYMLSKKSDIFDPEHDHISQDMTRPLSHYFISSSHNTYLTKGQVTSASSTQSYIKALSLGCRCVELDCWDGKRGEPVIYHGGTFTSKLSFKQVVETINQYAFKASPYPLILSLENHCSKEQQAVLAKHLTTILGEKLITGPLSDLPLTELPSPEELKGRILVKTKASKGEHSRAWTPPSSIRSSCADEESSYVTSPEGSLNVWPKTHRGFSELAVYCKSVKYRKSKQEWDRPPDEMYSFKERRAHRVMQTSGKLLVKHNTEHLSRIYPSGRRLKSSNYDPQVMWNSGCQMVALNFQTPGEQMDLNHGRFLSNGRCGYVLKPGFLCNPTSNFDPMNVEGGPGHSPTQLTIRLISAQQVPQINKEVTCDIEDPRVCVEIHGVGVDNAKDETLQFKEEGCEPHEYTRSFMLQVPELALVRFVVKDGSYLAGQFTLPFTSLRTGYRHIHLLKADGPRLFPAMLFVHVTVTRDGVPVKNVSEIVDAPRVKARSSSRLSKRAALSI